MVIDHFKIVNNHVKVIYSKIRIDHFIKILSYHFKTVSMYWIRPKKTIEVPFLLLTYELFLIVYHFINLRVTDYVLKFETSFTLIISNKLPLYLLK